MFLKNIFVRLLGVLLLLSLVSPSLTAQMIDITEIEEMEISKDFRLKDSIWEKGKYGFKVSYIGINWSRTPYFLTIFKKEKPIGILAGTKLDLFRPIMVGRKFHFVFRKESEINISDNPRLIVKDFPKDKLLNIEYISGKSNLSLPYKLVFKVEYEG